VQSQFADQKPVTCLLLQDAIEWRFHVTSSTDTLRHICRDMPGVKRLVGLPMDRAWMTCDQTALADFFDELEAVIDRIPAAFAYYVDESS
jgi:hypothetical protein